MRSILVKAGVSILIFGIINLLIIQYSPFYDQQRKYQAAIDSALENSCETIILGDSHIQSLRDVELGDNIRNLAFGADGIREMYAKTLIVLGYEIPIKHVLISTEPQIFNRNNSPNSGFLQKYMFINKDLRELYEVNLLEVTVNQVPLFNDDYIEFLRNQLVFYFKDMLSGQSEQLWSDMSLEDKVKMAEAIGKSDHSNILNSSEDTEIFTTLIARLKDRQVKTIGVNFPVSSYYIAQLPSEDKQRVLEFVSSLGLSKELEYTTFFESIEAFKDPDHLKEENVKVLVGEINKDLAEWLKLTK